MPRLLRDYLARIAFRYLTFSVINKPLLLITNCLFDSVEDRDYKIVLLKSLRSNATLETPKSEPSPQVVTTYSNGTRNADDRRKSAHIITQCF